MQFVLARLHDFVPCQRQGLPRKVAFLKSLYDFVLLSISFENGLVSSEGEENHEI